MGRVSVDLGKSLEDLVEIWLSQRGYAYERNVRVETNIGKVEADFIIYDNKGKVVVEVKNFKDPVDRDVVLKLYNTSIALGAYKAILVSSSGFTEGARYLARLLEKVELIELKDIVAELDSNILDSNTQYLEPQITLNQARDWISRHLVQKKLLILTVEQVVETEALYYPLYLMKVRIALDQARSKYREAIAVASAVTGFPVAYDKNKKILYEALRELVDMPPELLEVYRIYAGKRVSRSEIVQLYGVSLWNKLMRSLTARGLVRQVSARPVIVEITDVLPKSEGLEEAARMIIESRKTSKIPSGFQIKEHTISLGSIRSFLNQTLATDIISYTLVYIPLYRARLEDKSGNYRIVCITGWLKNPIPYMGCS